MIFSLCITCLLLFIAYTSLHRTFFTPLSNIPSVHPLAPYTSLRIQWKWYRGADFKAMSRAFLKRGLFIRLGPSEIAVRTMDGGVKNVYGLDNTFSSLRQDHTAYRKRLNRVYAKPYIQRSPSVRAILREILIQRVLPIVQASAAQRKPIDILPLNLAYGLDVVSAFEFGLARGTNFLEDERAREEWFAWYNESHSSRTIEENVGGVGDGEGEAHWTVFDRLAGGEASPNNAQTLQLASELLDHLVATRDTFGITFSFIILSICRHPQIQDALRYELSSINHPFLFKATQQDRLPTPESLESLSLLNAVIKESLHLRNTGPSLNPRVTPAGRTSTLGPWTDIPPGTRVGAYAWCIHRNERRIPGCENVEPVRAAQERWFWAFGSGSRRCSGMALASEMIRFAVAAIFTNFKGSVVDEEQSEDDETFVSGDGTARLWVTFEALQE
ncbi:cytochrome P450 [Aspergillus venezuelensis]